MATAPISAPRLFQNNGTWDAQRESWPDNNGVNPFVPGQFLKLVSGLLNPYVADDTAIFGLSADKSHATTDEPYSAPFGVNHNPIRLNGARFLMNITDGTGTVGSGSTTQANVTVGTLYSGFYLASPYGSILGVDASDSGTATKNIFKVVGLYTAPTFSDGDAAGDFNGRVIVEVISTAIQ